MKTIFYWRLSLVVLVVALAQVLPSFAQTVDIAAGQKRAQVCFSCHGEDGVSNIPGTPHLAGQDKAYLMSAMNDYRNGQRVNPTMVSMVKPLTERDIANIATYFSLAIRDQRGQRLYDAILVNERIKPVATVEVAGSNPVLPKLRTGKEVYMAACAACHASGVAGAPKAGDISAWKPRLSQGNDILVGHVIKGMGVMPPKGGCVSCSEQEIRGAVTYLVESSN